MTNQYAQDSQVAGEADGHTDDVTTPQHNNGQQHADADPVAVDAEDEHSSGAVHDGDASKTSADAENGDTVANEGGDVIVNEGGDSNIAANGNELTEPDAANGEEESVTMGEEESTDAVVDDGGGEEQEQRTTEAAAAGATGLTASTGCDSCQGAQANTPRLA